VLENDLRGLWEKERSLVSSIKEVIKSDDPNCEIVYIPNLIPKSHVDFIFVAMEPSFGTWARTEIEAQGKIDAGFRNFIDSWDVMAFHYCISEYLSASYYITDISKAAMKVKNAEKYREWIYKQWADILKEEIELIASKRCKIIPVGHTANNFISERFSDYRILDSVLHYSWSASRHRNRVPTQDQRGYAEYKKHLNPNCLVENAGRIITQQKIPLSTLRGIRNGLQRKAPTVTESRKKLMFSYFTVFTRLKNKL
jgi:hypothetical protein